MEFLEVVQTRQSIRAFKSNEIPLDILNTILETINLAPSAGNLQAYEVFLVKDPTIRTALAEAAYNQEFISQAPVVLVFCANPARSEPRYRERGVDLYCLQDTTIACTYAMLAATNFGLSSVWVGAFDERRVSQVIHTGSGLRPIAMLPIGYPNETPARRYRRKLSDVVHQI